MLNLHARNGNRVLPLCETRLASDLTLLLRAHILDPDKHSRLIKP